MRYNYTYIRANARNPDAVVTTGREKILVACDDTAASAHDHRREHPIVIRITADGCGQRCGLHDLMIL